VVVPVHLLLCYLTTALLCNFILDHRETLSQGERRLAAIMYTDMVGYTALGQKDESLSLAVVEAQQNLLRPVLARHRGREVKTMGDAFLVEFVSALEAVRCAYDIQRSVREFDLALPSEKRMHIRIGIHLGEVVEKEGDIYGDAVNVASRIQPLAEDGGVCLTRQVYDQVHNKLEFSLTSIGNRSLKNVIAPLEVYKMVMPWSEERVGPPTQLDKNRIAVLPFVNISPDPADEYFADGMTEELISTISRIGGLRVIARTSVMGYKGGQKKVSDVAKELEVGTVLEGSVRKAGDRLRITAQLIDSQTSDHLWAESYDRKLQDIFAVQSDVASNVADALKVKLLDREAAQIRKKPTENTEAYLLYLKGREYWNKRSEGAVRKAIEYFQLALDADPDFALALVGLADCWSVLDDWGYVSSAEAAPKVKRAVMTALKLDNMLAEAHASHAIGLANEWKWEEAELEFKRAIELNPNYASAHQWYSHSVLRYHRRLDEELKEAYKALELDPLAPVMCLNLGQTFYLREEYDKAIELFEKALAIDPNFFVAYLWQASCYLASGRNEKAIGLYETYLPRIRTETRTKLGLAWAYGMAGRIDEARRLVAKVEQSGDREGIPPIEFAVAYCALGETDKMSEYLDDDTIHVPWMLVDPLYKRYWSDPRFKAIKSKVGI
jgi:adenylate cyclase